MQLIECPNHEGAFDCTSFCDVCGGDQEFDGDATLACVVPNCTEQLTKDIWITELGFCVEHSNAYFNQELDPFTLERIN
jgi:hypothetical protein